MNFDDRLKLAEELVQKDKYKEAVELYSELYHERPNELHLLDKASFLFSRIVDGYYDFVPVTAIDFLFRGVSKFYKGELTGSSTDYDTAISLDPKMDVAYYYKAINFREAGRNDLAIKEVNYALSLNEHGTYYDALAESLFRLGNVKESIAAHELAIAKSPNDVRLWFNYGTHFAKLEMYANALIKLEQALEIDPMYTDAQRVLAYVYDKMTGY